MGDIRKICLSILLLFHIKDMSASAERDDYSARSPVPVVKTKFEKLWTILSQCSDHIKGGMFRMSDQDKENGFVLPSSAECQMYCLADSSCLGFNWKYNEKHPNKCYLLTEIGHTTKIRKAFKDWTSGYQNNCLTEIKTGDELSTYLSNPENIVLDYSKHLYLDAKRKYKKTHDGRVKFSKAVAQRLPSLIRFGHITEDEMGVAPSVEANESPYMPQSDAMLVTKDVGVEANGGPTTRFPIKKKHIGNWATTGLYAKPGKLVTVTTPQYAVGKIMVQIGHLTDTLYNQERLFRDPGIVLSFEIEKEKQVVGSPYGGIIFVKYYQGSSLTDSINMKFENVLELPTFVFGRDSDEDWNTRIKSHMIPWTLFKVPEKIIFILPSSNELGVGNISKVESSLAEWSDAFDELDAIAGINRTAPELFATDVQHSMNAGNGMGGMHAGYPIMGINNRAQGVFREGGLQNNGIGMGHEIGHNLVHPAYDLTHVMVNLYPLVLWEKMRIGWNKGDPWGRESRILGYILEGKSERILDFGLWQDILRIPLEFQGYDTLRNILAPYKDFEEKDIPDDKGKQDLWVKNYCKVTKLNMFDYFDFFNFPISEETKRVCKTQNMPLDINEYINRIQSWADAKNENCKAGWFGYSNKCIMITKGKYTWNEAGRRCQQLGGSLISIESFEDATWVQYIIMKSNIEEKEPSIWIGHVQNLSEAFPFHFDEEIGGFGNFHMQSWKADLTYNKVLNRSSPIYLGKMVNPLGLNRTLSCTYGYIADVAGSKGDRCLDLANADEDETFYVMCEK